MYERIFIHQKDKRRKFMRVIASANQKGGCGKTTTAINLSSSLSLKGQKVLLIDFDPQAHATMGLNVKPGELEKSIYDVVTPNKDEPLAIEDILWSIRENFDLAPSNIILSAFEQELSGLEGRENRLLQAIQPLEGKYDYIVIDCPPSIGHLSFNALRASEEVIIPIDMSLFSLRGVSKLLEIIILLKDKIGHDIRSRALITMFDRRTRYSRIVLEKVKAEFQSNVFETVIRYNIRLRETADFGLPVGDYDKHSIGHEDYENLADEILRLDAAPMHEYRNDSSAPQDILQKTEEYIDIARELPEEESPASDREQLFEDDLTDAEVEEYFEDEPPASEIKSFSDDEPAASEAEELYDDDMTDAEMEEYSEDEPAQTVSEMAALSDDEPQDSETEELPAYASQSNYSQMIEAIAANSRDSFLDDEEEF
jgi:chromosome partitioning protein